MVTILVKLSSADLLVGIGMGLVFAVSMSFTTITKKPYFFYPEKHEEGAAIRFELAEDVTFLNKAEHPADPKPFSGKFQSDHRRD